MAKIIHSETWELFDALIQEEHYKEYLLKLKSFERWMQEHSFRVCLVSIDVGYDNSLDRTRLRYLGLGGLFHDIGKSGIPYEIINKPSGLNSEEEKKMQEHVRNGIKLLWDPELAVVRYIIGSSHEWRREKENYPRKERRGDNESDGLAQIVWVADKYDSLASARPYKSAMESVTEVKRELRKVFTGDSKYVDQVLLRHDPHDSAISYHIKNLLSY